MRLPGAFTFNQANLQDFVDCKYRFFLRHVIKLEWPAVESEPVQEQEARMELGFRYHQLIQQYFSGVDAGILSAGIQDPDLLNWWDNFLKLGIKDLPGAKSAEKLISVPFLGFRLSAKYDLLLHEEPKKVTIYDWKTSSSLPRRKTLLDRIQSKVYPLILATCSIPPENIQMIYWYPAFPDAPASFKYSSSQLETDQYILNSLVTEISELEENQFEKTSNERACRYCRYRSLCARGEKAGVVDEDETVAFFEDPFNINFDLL